MSTWYSKNLGDATAAHAPSLSIHKVYLAHALAHGEDSGAAVFSRLDLSTGHVTVYFTPEAAAMAAQYGATPCDKPNRDGRLGLLAGSARDWAKHFPD